MPFLIKKNTSISEIKENSPRAIELLTEYGLSCANCFLSQFDTIEVGAKLHGMTDSEIDKIIKEINSILKKENKKK